MLNIRKNDLGVVVEENNPLNQNSNNTNNKVLIDEKERENSKASLLPATEAAKVAGGNVSPRKSDITPRYMNWYSKSKSNTVGQPLIMDAKQLIQRKENRSQSVPQDDEIERYLSKDEDAESGKNHSSKYIWRFVLALFIKKRFLVKIRMGLVGYYNLGKLVDVFPKLNL